ncbi:hypothetical protein L7F22_051701 [Adiantum nelumboides]|nr:hypothetical protein [Adiantum nelumboides]
MENGDGRKKGKATILKGRDKRLMLSKWKSPLCETNCHAKGEIVEVKKAMEEELTKAIAATIEIKTKAMADSIEGKMGAKEEGWWEVVRNNLQKEVKEEAQKAEHLIIQTTIKEEKIRQAQGFPIFFGVEDGETWLQDYGLFLLEIGLSRDKEMSRFMNCLHEDVQGKVEIDGPTRYAEAVAYARGRIRKILKKRQANEGISGAVVSRPVEDLVVKTQDHRVRFADEVEETLDLETEEEVKTDYSSSLDTDTTWETESSWSRYEELDVLHVDKDVKGVFEGQEKVQTDMLDVDHVEESRPTDDDICDEEVDWGFDDPMVEMDEESQEDEATFFAVEKQLVRGLSKKDESTSTDSQVDTSHVQASASLFYGWEGKSGKSHCGVDFLSRSIEGNETESLRDELVDAELFQTSVAVKELDPKWLEVQEFLQTGKIPED